MPWRSSNKWTLGRWFRLLLTVGLVLTLIALAAIWWLASSRPAWWPASGVLPADAAERASALERGGSRALSEPRDESKPWTISISESDANAWLAHRLILWAENRGVEFPALLNADGREIAPPRVAFDTGRIRIGIEVNGRVVGLSAAPAVEHGKLYVKGARFFLGRLELSAAQTASLSGTISERMAANAGEEARSTLRALLVGTHAIADPARFALDDGREITLERIVIEDDRMLITCRTLAPRN